MRTRTGDGDGEGFRGSIVQMSMPSLLCTISIFSFITFFFFFCLNCVLLLRSWLGFAVCSALFVTWTLEFDSSSSVSRIQLKISPHKWKKHLHNLLCHIHILYYLSKILSYNCYFLISNFTWINTPQKVTWVIELHSIVFIKIINYFL